MRIISLIHTTIPRTGGQRYNVHLEECLHAEPGTAVMRICEPYERYAWWSKPLAPLWELRQLKGMQKGDAVLLGDTTYKYHYLLQWCCRHIKHCQTIVMVHHLAYLEQHGLKRWLMEKITNRYLQEADWILVPSQFTLERANSLFGEKVVLLPLPFSVHYEENKLFTPGRLLFVGNIEPRKGLHYLPAVMQQLAQDVQLHIVGAVQDQAYYNQLTKAFEAAGVDQQVRWHGALTKDELEQQYRQAEVFVFPSQLEGFGIVLIEAMKYGLPIVTFNNSAMPYTIIHQQNGLMSDNQDTQQMASLIQSVLGNEALRKHLQTGMQETLSHLSSEEDFQHAVTTFTELLNQKQ